MIPIGFENRWAGDEKERAVSLLLTLRGLMNRMDILMCLVSGTLLGAVRMNAIMPWDDDIDVSIRMEDWPRLLDMDGAIVCDNLRFARVTDRDMHPFMRAFWDHRDFPFIDIFVHDPHGDVVRSYGSDSRQYIDVPYSQWFPYSTIELEGHEFKTPNDPEAYCDILYPDWRTVARTWDWDHRNDCPSTSRVYTASWDYKARQLVPASGDSI